MVNNDNFLLKEIPNNIYYVYGYYLEDDTPFYIGMGKGDRIIKHLTKCHSDAKAYNTPFYRKLRKLISNKSEFSYRKIKENLSQEDAWNLEKELIIKIGRKYITGGTLYNLTNGGNGGGCGKLSFKKVAIYDSTTLELFKEFPSVKDCAKFLNIKSTGNVREAYTLRTKLRKYYILYYNDKPELTFTRKVKCPPANMCTRIISKNIHTNCITIFDSCKSCCAHHKLHKQTLRDKIKRNLVYKEEYIFSYGKQ